MLQFNYRVVSALSVVEYLLKNYNRTCSGREVAEKTGVSESAITTMTPSLVRANIVKSAKGYCGGLTISHTDISLWDVISAVSIPINHNLPDASSWKNMWDYFERSLKRTKVFDLIDKQEN